MRFPIKSKPQIGDTRKVIRFAWYPQRVQGHWIWLESYYARQQLEWVELRTWAASQIISMGYIKRWLTYAKLLKGNKR